MTATETAQLEQALERLAENRQDDAAWSTLIALTFPIALATANRTLRGTLDLARDATSEAFARIARYANFHVLDLKKADAFVQYLKQVTRRTSFDLLKRLARHSPEIQWDPDLLEAIADSDARTPEDTLAAEELYAEIKSILRPDELVLLELMLKGSSLQDVAEQLGVTYGAAGVRRHRLRGKIRRHLTGKTSGQV